jgi:3-hydroxyisobutyrate dehydrogenase-like beta-hydroxyacid dehydrogenase
MSPSARCGLPLTAFDLSPDTRCAVTARAATSAAECAGRDVLLTSLPRPDHVASVMRDGGALQALRPGSVWVDLTTNRRLVAELTADTYRRGVLDSPVTGASTAPHNRLTLFVGGDEATVDRMGPICRTSAWSSVAAAWAPATW